MPTQDISVFPSQWKWKHKEINGNDYHVLSKLAWYDYNASIEDCDGDWFYVKIKHYDSLVRKNEFDNWDDAESWIFQQLVELSGKNF